MKPVVLAISFLLIFSQLMGKSYSHEVNSSFVIECQDEKQGADEMLSSDATDAENEFLVADMFVFHALERIERIYLKEISSITICYSSFWRPPQNNSFLRF